LDLQNRGDLQQGEVISPAQVDDLRPEDPLRRAADVDGEADLPGPVGGHLDDVRVGDEQTGVVDAERRAARQPVGRHDLDERRRPLAARDDLGVVPRRGRRRGQGEQQGG
jgi:hypothetical protein